MVSKRHVESFFETTPAEREAFLSLLDRAREHGDLVGPFGAVAEHVTAALTKFGLTGFGEKGDPFDPTRHEARSAQLRAQAREPSGVPRRGPLDGRRRCYAYRTRERTPAD